MRRDVTGQKSYTIFDVLEADKRFRSARLHRGAISVVHGLRVLGRPKTRPKTKLLLINYWSMSKKFKMERGLKKVSCYFFRRKTQFSRDSVIENTD